MGWRGCACTVAVGAVGVDIIIMGINTGNVSMRIAVIKAVAAIVAAIMVIMSIISIIIL